MAWSFPPAAARCCAPAPKRRWPPAPATFCSPAIRSSRRRPGQLPLLPATRLRRLSITAAKSLLDAKQLKVKRQADPPKPVNACFLPQLVRVAVASQQHYGVSMTRGLAKPEGEVIAFDALPAGVRTELAPFEAALRADPERCSVARCRKPPIFDREQTGSQRARRLPQSRARSGRMPSGCAAGFSSWKNRSPTQAAIKAAAFLRTRRRTR